jgi:TP901 family phage tail tape measure protein
MGEDTDGMVKSTSKLQALIKGMTGFDILESDGKTFKNIYDIMIGIGEAWDSLDDIQQASLLEKLAGKNQSNALAAALSNIDILKKSYQEAMNSEGSAMKEQSKYEQSIQYSIDQTKAKLEELSNDLISSDFLKGLIDAGGTLIDILDALIDKFGILNTVAVGAGLFKVFNKENLDLLLNWSLHTQGRNENGVAYKCVLLRFKKESKVVMTFEYCIQ